MRSKLNQCSQTGQPTVWLEGSPQRPGAHWRGMWDTYVTYVCTDRGLLACCYAHVGEEMGTHIGAVSGLARLHSHLLQKQKWQPHRQGCDSSPGETAPAVAVKALAPAGVAVSLANASAQTQTSPLGACPTPCAQGLRRDKSGSWAPPRWEGTQGEEEKT